jgi:hypothetical protein
VAQDIDTVMGFCDHVNEQLGSIKAGNVLTNYTTISFKGSPSLRSYLVSLC